MSEDTKERLLKSVFLRGGDLSGLSSEERWLYYRNLCEELGLNPALQPFQLVEAYDGRHRQNRLMLYLTKGGADQLRRKFNISTRIVSTEFINDGKVFQVIVEGRMGDRVEMNIGTASLAEVTDKMSPTKTERVVSSNEYAKGIMMACTRALRRVTVSMVGLGVTDESELSMIPNAMRVDWGHDSGDEFPSSPPPPPPSPPNVYVSTAAVKQVKQMIRQGGYTKIDTKEPEEEADIPTSKQESTEVSPTNDNNTEQSFASIFDLADTNTDKLEEWEKARIGIERLANEAKASAGNRVIGITQKTLNYLCGLEKYYPEQGEDFKKWLLFIFGVDSRKKLKQHEAAGLIKYLNNIKEKSNE